jgi:polyhydroxybutyrate depolymerase
MGRLLRWVLIAVVGLPLLLVAGLVGLVVACTPPQPEAPALPGRVERGGMRHDGLERTWTLYVPAALAESPALLLVLHGSSHDAEMVRRVSLWRFDELAERDGFLVAYPEGLANSGALRLGPEWNDCRKSTRNRAHDLDVDDVGFLRRLIADLSETYRVDRRRVYATGYSDGGQMSYRLATEIPDEIAGVAVVMAQQAEPENSNCLDPRGRISILVMNGTDDPIIPFGGGEASLFGWFSAGRVQPMTGTLAHWRNVNGIKQPGISQRLPDVEPGDRSWVERQSWHSASGHEVVGYTIHGGGHTWPGGWQFFHPRGIGHTNRDIRAADEIWAFLSRQRLRQADP